MVRAGLCLLLLLLAFRPAQAADAAAPPLTAAQAQDLLGTLRDDAKRQELIRTLEALASAQSREAPEAAEKEALAGELFDQAGAEVRRIGREVVGTARMTLQVPGLVRWLAELSTRPGMAAGLLDVSWRVGLVLAVAGAAQLVVGWMVEALRRQLAAHRPPPAPQPPEDDAHPLRARSWRMLRRMPYVLAGAAAGLLPLVGFAVAVNLMLDIPLALHPAVHGLVEVAAPAWLLFAAVRVLLEVALAPRRRRFRLLPIGDDMAALLHRWLVRLIGLAVFGGALLDAAVFLGLPSADHLALVRVLALVVHLGLIAVVLRCRAPVARRIAGPPGTGGWVLLRHRVAAVWHYAAIAYITAVWFVWAMRVEDGFLRLQRAILLTALALIVTRLLAITLLGLLSRLLHAAAQPEAGPSHAQLYYPLMRRAVLTVLAGASALVVLEIWGVPVLDWLVGSRVGRHVLSAFATSAVALLAAIVVWVLANAALDRSLSREGDAGHAAQLVRLQTLRPVLRTALMIAIVVLVGLTVLSEIGVNIGPLLAGAGIVGIAVGFGSQKLVQDVITGLFLLLENAVQVGEWVTVAGLSGTVEDLSIRTIRLRAGDGALHFVPFSAVTSVTNTNRGLGNAAVNIALAAEEDVDRAAEVLCEIARELGADPAFAPLMRSDLQLWGVDRVDGASVTLAGQIVCTDAGRWGVQREFNRRYRKRFAELGIRLALPTQAVRVVTAPPRGVKATTPPARTTPPGASPPPGALGHES